MSLTDEEAAASVTVRPVPADLLAIAATTAAGLPENVSVEARRAAISKAITGHVPASALGELATAIDQRLEALCRLNGDATFRQILAACGPEALAHTFVVAASERVGGDNGERTFASEPFIAALLAKLSAASGA